MEADVQYDGHGDHDPFGLIFALAADEASIRAGRGPEPMVIRANKGDCVEVALTNKLAGPLPTHTHPGVPVDQAYAMSTRVSLHTQLLTFDVGGSDGSAVGFNPDQTVAPSKSRLYRWYADDEVGAANLWSFTDIRSQRHHGLYGGLVVEPAGSTYLDPATGGPLASGAAAVIRNAAGSFREFVVMPTNGVAVVDRSGVPVPDDPMGDDFEDQGQKGYNYRTEPFLHRLAADPDAHKVFSSAVHGDPFTPLFRAYPGDAVRMRLLMAADKDRNTSFTLHAHQWPEEPNNPDGGIRSNESSLGVGSVRNLQLVGGAGGLGGYPGDYMYRTGVFRTDLQQGMWGILRVEGLLKADLLPLP